MKRFIFIFFTILLWQNSHSQNVATYSLLPFTGDEGKICENTLQRNLATNTPTSLFYRPNESISSLEEYTKQTSFTTALLISGTINEASDSFQIDIVVHEAASLKAVIRSTTQLSKPEFENNATREASIKKLSNTICNSTELKLWLEEFYAQQHREAPSVADLLRIGNKPFLVTQPIETAAKNLYLSTNDYRIFKSMELLQMSIKNYNNSKKECLETIIPRLKNGEVVSEAEYSNIFNRLEVLASNTEIVTNNIFNYVEVYSQLPKRKVGDMERDFFNYAQKNIATFVNNYLIIKDQVIENLILNQTQYLLLLQVNYEKGNQTALEQENYKKERERIYRNLIRLYEVRISIYEGLRNAFYELSAFIPAYEKDYKELREGSIFDALNTIIAELKANIE